MLQVFAPNSFDVIESTDILEYGNLLLDKELWRLIFAALKQNGEINLNVNLLAGINSGIENGLHSNVHDTISSLLKLNGFTNIHINNNIIQGKKP